MKKLLLLLALAATSWGQITVTGGGTQAVQLVSPTPITCPPSATTVICTAPPPTVTLPVEVFGPAGTTTTTTFVVPTAPTGSVLLSLQVHGLRYSTEASLEVNTSGWLSLSTPTVTLTPTEAAFGGIGGMFSTVTMTLPLPSGAVVAGANTISFRFNQSDGVSSGFRVLGFNLQTTTGSNLLAVSSFVQVDPTTWTPPLPDPTDIATGKTLWSTAALTDTASGTTTAITAHCGDCHSIDGRDLKYFNFSNLSISTRAQFHGLTATQGNQIASYIRSLTTPSPGLPWNPPYQPGPGMDTVPVANWSAGAGLSAVLPNDQAMLAYLAPGGSTAGWAASAYLNARTTPVAIPLPDWNMWLPQVYPGDAFGTTFTTSGSVTYYNAMRAAFVANNAASYKNQVLTNMQNWNEPASVKFLSTIQSTPAASWTQADRQDVYGVAQWRMVKNWELNQMFGLEGMTSAIYGTKAATRGWAFYNPFNTAPNLLKIPAGPGLLNGGPTANTYLSTLWYLEELILDDGDGIQAQHSPIDYSYFSGFLRSTFDVQANTPGIMLQIEVLVKALQEFTLTGINPSVPGGNGFHPIATNPEVLVNYQWGPMWSATPTATMSTLMTAYLQAWYNQVSTYTPAQWYAGGWTTATNVPNADNWEQTFDGMLWYSLPRMRTLFGVPATLTSTVATYAATIWPLGNWASLGTATCTGGISASKCSSDGPGL